MAALSNRQDILLRLLLVKQGLRQGTKDFQTLNAIERIQCAQQLDFSIETLLKTVSSVFGPPADYFGSPNDYFLKISEVKRQKYNPAGSGFYRLYDEVVGIYNDPAKKINQARLPLKDEIDRLHKVRNSAQHDGIVPDPEMLSLLSQQAIVFVVALLRQTFNVDYLDLRLSTLIQDLNIRELLTKAEKEYESGDYRKATASARSAFEKGEELEKAKRLRRHFVPSFVASIDGKSLPDRASRQIDNLTKAVETMSERLDLMTLGIDPQELREFNDITLRSRMHNLSKFYVQRGPEFIPSKAQTEFVLNFVFDTLLRWKI